MPKVGTSLTRLIWSVPEIGDLRVVEPTDDHVQLADAGWPELRRVDDFHRVWRWSEILAGKPEQFEVAVSDTPVAFWCSGRKHLPKLAGIHYYRLDYVEVHPTFRGGILPVIVFGLIARRALELGAKGLVLAAFQVPGLHEPISAWAHDLAARQVGTIPSYWYHSPSTPARLRS